MERLRTTLIKADTKKNVLDTPNTNTAKVSTLTRLHQQIGGKNENVAGNMFSDKSDEARMRSMRLK